MRILRVVAVAVVSIVTLSTAALLGAGARPTLPFGLGAPPPPPPLTQDQVVALVQPSVVTIKVTVYRGAAVEGTGFLYSDSGQILTTAHIISRATDIKVTESSGDTNNGILRGVDRPGDVAELQTFSGTAKALKRADKPVKLGSHVVVFGNPVTSGLVTGLDRDLTVGSATYHNLIQTNAFLSAGNSGGPMVDMSGNLVGLVLGGGQGNAFAIPVAGLESRLAAWAQNELIPLGPPKVDKTPAALAVPKSFLPAGFHLVFKKKWGPAGYHVQYTKEPTYTQGGEGIDSYVIVNPTVGGAQTNYQFYLVHEANRLKFKRLGEAKGYGDEARYLQYHVGIQIVYELLWRDRNVVVILDWSAALPNSEASFANVRKMATRQEAPIAANLATFQ